MHGGGSFLEKRTCFRFFPTRLSALPIQPRREAPLYFQVGSINLLLATYYNSQPQIETPLKPFLHFHYDRFLVLLLF